MLSFKKFRSEEKKKACILTIGIWEDNIKTKGNKPKQKLRRNDINKRGEQQQQNKKKKKKKYEN